MRAPGEAPSEPAPKLYITSKVKPVRAFFNSKAVPYPAPPLAAEPKRLPALSIVDRIAAVEAAGEGMQDGERRGVRLQRRQKNARQRQHGTCTQCPGIHSHVLCS